MEKFWHAVAISSCMILFALVGFLGAKGYEKLEGKLDKVVYEKDQFEHRCREAAFIAKLNVIYNAHVPDAFKLPVDMEAIKNSGGTR